MWWFIGYGIGMVLYFIWQLDEEGFEWADLSCVAADCNEYVWLFVAAIFWPIFFGLNLLVYLVLAVFHGRRWWKNRKRSILKDYR